MIYKYHIPVSDYVVLSIIYIMTGELLDVTIYCNKT